MLSPSDFHAELEADRRARDDELRLIERIYATLDSTFDQERVLRMLIILTYAHFEGFCRFALTAYASTINAMHVECYRAIPPIAAASLSNVFSALRDPQRKHEVFKKSIPEDAALHLHAREQIFIVDFERITASSVEIPDNVIDTKSNLDTDILMKLLFRLGLDFEPIERFRGTINRLVGTRNAIAHGDRLKRPSKEEADRYLSSAREIMGILQDQVYTAVRDGSYLRAIQISAETEGAIPPN